LVDGARSLAGGYELASRARLPESKEAAIGRFWEALERWGIATAGWWDRQLGLCLLGVLVQFGWERALGDDAERPGGSTPSTRVPAGSRTGRAVNISASPRHKWV
jgi:hypothetical protein